MAFVPINKGQFTLETNERSAFFERNRGYGVEEAYKENRRQWLEYPNTQFVADYPLHVDIELSSICDLKCPMCYTITEEFKAKVKPAFMSFELFTKIVDESAAGGVYSIRLSLRGESFLHKQIVNCVRYAKNKGIKEVSTLTNGLRLNEAMFTEMMEVGLDWITISFDGLGEIYEKIRRPAKFSRALEKVANYHRIKQDSKRVKPVVKIQSILPAIVDEPEAFYNTFAPICDLVSANPIIDYLQCDDPKSIEYEEGFICPQLYQRMVIAADGPVLMCANDEENGYILGDLMKQNIHEVWHGKPIETVRQRHKIQEGYKDFTPCVKCYLPRKTKKNVIVVGGREIIAENYVGRSEKIGT